MEIKNQVKFDMASGGAPIRIDAVQGELATRVLEASLYSSGVPLDFSGCVASVAYEKPDGTSGWYDKMPNGTPACEINGNAVSAKFAPQMVAVPGDVVAVIRIESSDGSQRAITFPFVVKVYEDPGANSEKSEDYYEVNNWSEVNGVLATIREQIRSVASSVEDVSADVSALNKQYELIEDVTLEEGVSSFTRNKDTNGNPYNFSAVRIYVGATAAEGANNKSQIIFNLGTKSSDYAIYFQCTGGITNTARATLFNAQNENGFRNVWFASEASGGTTTNIQARAGQYIYVWENVVGLGLAPYPTDVKIPAGTRIRIYGIRG